MIFPWNKKVWQSITQIKNLHHSLMVTGISGVGKQEFCFSLAKYLLCENSTNNQCCGRCHNCNFFAAGTHPDFHLLTSEKENIVSRVSLISLYKNRYQDVETKHGLIHTKPRTTITVDQIRRLIDQFINHSYISKNKVALILPAEAMNENAANSLLKILEEPLKDSYFILMSSNSHLLSETIRSRCMEIHLSTPRKTESLKWLLLNKCIEKERAKKALSVSVGPLDAKSILDRNLLELHQKYLNHVVEIVQNNQDAVKFAKMITTYSGLDQFLHWFQYCITDLLKWKVGTIQPNWVNQSHQCFQSLPVDELYVLYDRIIFYRRIKTEAINEQMAIEDLLLSLLKGMR